VTVAAQGMDMGLPEVWRKSWAIADVVVEGLSWMTDMMRRWVARSQLHQILSEIQLNEAT